MPRSDLPSNDLRSRVQSLRIPEDQKQSGGRGGLWLLILLLLGTNGYTGYRLYQLMQSGPKADTAQAVAGSTEAGPVAPASATGSTRTWHLRSLRSNHPSLRSRSSPAGISLRRSRFW